MSETYTRRGFFEEATTKVGTVLIGAELVATATVTASIYADKVMRDRAAYQWNNSSIAEKIAKIERDQAPSFVNPRVEMVKQVSRATADKLKGVYSAKDLAQKVQFLSTPEFTAFLLEEYGDDITDDMRQELMNSAEMVGSHTNRVMMHEPVMAKLTEPIRRHPATKTRIPGINLDRFAEKVVLFHAFSHVHESVEEEAFDSIALLPGISISSAKGFHMFERTSDGLYVSYSGAAEAMTDHHGLILSKGYGEYMHIGQALHVAPIISTICQKLGISDSEFTQYYTGKKTRAEFIERINANHKGDSFGDKHRRAHAVLGAIALSYDDPSAVDPAKVNAFAHQTLKLS